MNMLGVETPRDISLAIQAKEATYKKYDGFKKFADKVSQLLSSFTPKKALYGKAPGVKTSWKWIISLFE